MKSLLLVFLGMFTLAGSAQEERTEFLIRDHRASLLMSIDGVAVGNVSYSDYGNVLQFNSVSKGYLYQSQEYDEDFDLYFFPSRLYSVQNGRFLQPDPEAQFFSPYLYTKGDPINFADYDGNVAKPLVLYAEESRPSGAARMPAATEGLQSEIDAYYYPLSDFVNGDTPLDLAEWNGNVFIESHTSHDGGIASEYYRKGEKFKLKKNLSEGIYHSNDGLGEFGFVQPNALSERLAKLTKITKVPLKNVTFGGCEGSAVAKRMRKSVNKVFRKLKAIPGKMKFHGVKPDYTSTYVSPPVMADIEAGFMEAPTEVVGTVPGRNHMFVSHEDEESMYYDFSGAEAEFSGEENIFSHVEGSDLNSFVNGDIPDQLRPHMNTYDAEIRGSSDVTSRVPRVRRMSAEF